MEQSKIRMLAEAGVAIAIAQVLSFITIFHMPQGGSIKAAALVPLMITRIVGAEHEVSSQVLYMVYYTLF